MLTESVNRNRLAGEGLRQSGLPSNPPAPVTNRSQPNGRALQLAVAGDALVHDGKWQDALRHYREAVWLSPLTKEFHLRLAHTAWHLGQTDWARRHFAEALRLDPRCAEAHEALGQMHLDAGEVAQAAEHAAAALALAPTDPFAITSRALVLSAEGRGGDAWAMLEPLTRGAAPMSARLACVCAAVGPKAGRANEALGILERGLREPGLAPADRRTLHFAAANLLDRLGRYDEAFEHARLGNGLARQLAPAAHDPDGYADFVSRRIAFATPQRMRALPRATHGNRRPVFIVGMPRSGTSLVEQILASHPAVFGAGELPTMGQVAASIANANWREGAPYPQCLESLSVKTANRLAGHYLSHIESLNNTATYVTDKMPLNSTLVGLIDLLLPGCHVIHCVRDPLDTCLSCYLTGFKERNEFTNDLGHLGAYYRDYRRLMDHWTRVVELPILEVRYEDLVREPAAGVKRMLDFLNLPWDDRCLRFHENPRPVNTASREQVRRPVYQSSVGRWKHYEKHLAPLIAALASSPPSSSAAGRLAS